MWLSSERFGITAKIDVVEGEGGRVVPIEYKRGKKPDVEIRPRSVTLAPACRTGRCELTLATLSCPFVAVRSRPNLPPCSSDGIGSSQSSRPSLFTGLDCHYLEWDTARFEHTVVLVHGFLDPGWGWARTVEAGLAERYHVGRSRRARARRQRSRRCGGLLRHHGLRGGSRIAPEARRAGSGSLVGHSMGGSFVSYATG